LLQSEAPDRPTGQILRFLPSWAISKARQLPLGNGHAAGFSSGSDSPASNDQNLWMSLGEAA